MVNFLKPQTHQRHHHWLQENQGWAWQLHSTDHMDQDHFIPSHGSQFHLWWEMSWGDQETEWQRENFSSDHSIWEKKTFQTSAWLPCRNKGWCLGWRILLPEVLDSFWQGAILTPFLFFLVLLMLSTESCPCDNCGEALCSSKTSPIPTAPSTQRETVLTEAPAELLSSCTEKWKFKCHEWNLQGKCSFPWSQTALCAGQIFFDWWLLSLQKKCSSNKVLFEISTTKGKARTLCSLTELQEASAAFVLRRIWWLGSVRTGQRKGTKPPLGLVPSQCLNPPKNPNFTHFHKSFSA